jgi:hypothetical protein
VYRHDFYADVAFWVVVTTFDDMTGVGPFLCGVFGIPEAFLETRHSFLFIILRGPVWLPARFSFVPSETTTAHPASTFFCL